MTILERIDKNLKAFEEKYGIPARDADQGSDVWRSLKLGVISASNAHKAVAGEKTQTRATYMNELVAQVCTGILPEISGAPLDWGHQHEAAARSYYEFASGKAFREVPFVFMNDEFRVGVSPDALPTENSGVEIKCPYNSANYIDFLVNGKIKSEWSWQINMSMWVTGTEVWELAQFDPRMQKSLMKIVEVERDERKIKTLEDAIPQFIHDMDKALKVAGFTFGEQWERLKQEKSA